MEPPSPATSSLASESDIEMITLEEIPKHYTPGDTPQSHPDDHDSDDDDGGERALLGENTQTRWRENIPSNPKGFWKQTSGIVVEVSGSSFLRCTVSDPGTLDTTNAPFHHNGPSVYGGTVF